MPRKYLKYLEGQGYVNKIGYDPEPVTCSCMELGMGVFQHDVPCFVCFDNKAVITSEQKFQPCWQCQLEGYTLKKLGWFKRLIRRLKGEEAFIQVSAEHWGKRNEGTK